MSAVQMRPTFLLESQLPAAEVVQRIRSAVASPTQDFRGQFARHHAVVSMEPSKRNFWSPWMNLEIRDVENGGQIFGRFSPHPSIWTAFMFSYLTIGVLVFFAAMFGISQQLSGQSPWAYCVIPIGLIIAAVLWFASKAGQKLACNEMKLMHSMVEECLMSDIEKT